MTDTDVSQEASNVSISHDAVSELLRILRHVFNEARTVGVVDSERNVTRVPILPAWILLPVTAYKPDHTENPYHMRNEIVEPIFVGDVHCLDSIYNSLLDRAIKMGPTYELAINTSLVIGWKDGTVNTHRLSIYDGEPGLTRVGKDILKYFNALKTSNSFHFYAKHQTKLWYTFDKVDKRWHTYNVCGAGYIRITQNVKGPITRWLPTPKVTKNGFTDE